MSRNQLGEQRQKKESLASRLPLGAWIGGGACALLLLVVGTKIESENARNLILAVGGAVGLGLAAWRGWVLQQQAETQQANLKQTQQISRRDERFKLKQLAMDQLANENPVVRDAGVLGLIMAMEDENEERPLELAALLSSYIARSKAERGARGEEPKPPKQEHFDDAVRALRLFGTRERRHNSLPDKPFVTLNLPGVWLQQADLSGLCLAGLLGQDANLSGISAHQSNFSGAQFYRTNLSGADLRDAVFRFADLVQSNLEGSYPIDADFSEAKLSRCTLLRADLFSADLSKAELDFADLAYADLSDTIFDGTNISASSFSNVEGLVQAQLDSAV